MLLERVERVDCRSCTHACRVLASCVMAADGGDMPSEQGARMTLFAIEWLHYILTLCVRSPVPRFICNDGLGVQQYKLPSYT